MNIWNPELWICVSVTIFTTFVIKWWRWRKLPPGPWGLPLVGYLPWLDPQHAYLTLTRLSERYGPIYSVQMGNIFAVVISDSKIIRHAFNNDALSGRADLFLAHGIMQGCGIIAAQGQMWKEQRKFAITSLKNLGVTKYGPKREQLEALILTGVDKFMEKLSASSSCKDGMEITHPLMDCVGNIMNQLLFSRTWKEDDPTWLQLQYYSDDGLKKMGEAGVINFLPYLRFVPKYKKAFEFVVGGLASTHEIYEQLITEHTGEEDDIVAGFLKEKKSRGDQVGTFTDKQLLFLLGDLFGAGVDTTVTSVSWFLLLVACHPEVQTKIQQELDSVCGDFTHIPRLRDSPRFHYLEAAIAEAQRIRSVVPMGVPHGAVVDCTLESYTIPKGTMIIPLQWAVHMNPKTWPQPEIFKPERFLDAYGNFCKPDAFIPFQTGKRICLGEEFGRIMLFSFISKALKRFTITLPERSKTNGTNPLEGVFDMLLKPKEARVIANPRHFTKSSSSFVEQ